MIAMQRQKKFLWTRRWEGSLQTNPHKQAACKQKKSAVSDLSSEGSKTVDFRPSGEIKPASQDTANLEYQF